MAMARVLPSPSLHLPIAPVASLRKSLLVTCHNSAPSSGSGSGAGGSCCGGSGSSKSSGGGCGSHGKAASSLANVGKEFEHMVATSTLLEFEKNYVSKPMEGTITREIIQEVMDTFPEASDSKSEEKFLDINEILKEARVMSKGNFIFSDNSDDMVFI